MRTHVRKNRIKERDERKENYLHTFEGKRTRTTAMTKRKPPAGMLLFGDCEALGVVAPA
jgi:hypothetical protein